MSFRLVGTGLAALTYLVAGSEAGLCRLQTQLSSGSAIEITTSTTSSIVSHSTNSVTSATKTETPVLSTLLTVSTSSEYTFSLSSVVLSDSTSSETTTSLSESSETATSSEPNEIITTTTSVDEVTETTTFVSPSTPDTTTSIAAPTSFVVNGGFDDEPETTNPWVLAGQSPTLDNSLYFDGTRSLKIQGDSDDAVTFLGQSISASLILPDTEYTFSLQLYPGQTANGVGCVSVSLYCTDGASSDPIGLNNYIPSTLFNAWQPVSTTRQFTQTQLSNGNIKIRLSVNSGEAMTGTACWIDALKLESA